MNRKPLIAFIFALLFVGGGVCYVTLVRPGSRGREGPGSQSPASPLLIEERKDTVTGETGVEGHRDYPFWNPTDRSVTLRLDRTDCDCAHVSACLTPQAWKDLDSQAFLKQASNMTLTWQSLETASGAFPVPPKSHGLIRVKWITSKVGLSSIGINLLVDDGVAETRKQLIVNVDFYPPILFCSEDKPSTAQVDVGPLKAGEERTARFFCFSTTRDRFTLTPEPPSSDPCLVYDAPQPLTKEELQELSNKPGSPLLRACYRVRVTVREQADGHRMDIGPFHRQIAYKTDVGSDSKVTTYINGTVVGEVALAAVDNKDYIDFGKILPTDPKPVIFMLESRDSHVQLTLDEKRTVQFLNVRLLDGKEGKPSKDGKIWRVSALFRSDSPYRGPFPNINRKGYDTTVLCSIVFNVSRPDQAAPRARRLIIPVRGDVKIN